MKNPDLLTVARALREKALRPSRLLPLIFMTDPARISDPIGLILSLPKSVNGHMTIILRHFGDENRLQTARELRQLSFARDMQLLIGNDPELAIACGADGIHYTRAAEPQTIAMWKHRCPDWIVSQAGKKDPLAYIDPNNDAAKQSEESLAHLDGLFISSVFESTSPSAGSPIGVSAFSALCRKLDVAVFALGGITPQTASTLMGSGTAGLASVSAIKGLAV